MDEVLVVVALHPLEVGQGQDQDLCGVAGGPVVDGAEDGLDRVLLSEPLSEPLRVGVAHGGTLFFCCCGVSSELGSQT